MKISNSKRQLAQLLIKAGVKQFPKGATWVAQGSADLKASFYGGYKPKRCFGETAFCGDYCGRIHDVQLSTLTTSWHKTVLSRDEFDQIVAETVVTSEPDADGWIEWNVGGIHIGDFQLADYKILCTPQGSYLTNGSMNLIWHKNCEPFDIADYRRYKPELAKSTAVGDDETNLAAKEELEALELTPAPALDQLLQYWRNADDFAQRKQTEADEVAAMRDERWQAVQARAGEMGVTIDHVTEERSEAVLHVTNRSQLELGDVIWIGRSGVKEDERRLPEGEYQVVKVGTIGVLHNGVTFYPDFSFGSWRFIRRP